MRFKAELTEPGIWRWCGLVCVLLAIVTATEANDASHYRIEAATDCPQDMVDAHVRQQFALYGPRSKVGEYFGFVFFFEGSINSAIVKGRSCPTSNLCSIDTAKAAPLIPKGAKVLGEWHTHTQKGGARTLSAEDVRGAQNNRHIRCYAAYYSQPDGDIYAWDPVQTSVPTAMASRFLIGTYRQSADADSVAIIAAHETPGTECLSTNTNAHTAGTTKKYCRRSTISRSRSARPAARRG